MNTQKRKQQLEGCYVTIPTPFADEPGYPVAEDALRSYVRFLIENGLNAARATFLAAGAAGDFSTMTFDERVRVASVVVEEVAGRVPEAMPFYKLWVRIENEYTSGDGYLDKLCMELIGLPSSRCRPPTRDVRSRYRDDTRAMMQAIGCPRLTGS